MPQTEVIFYAEADGTCPALDWMDGVPDKVQDKCFVKIERLAECGHELRRPEADFLRDDIYELRVGYRHVNYRMLYFFHSKGAVITHGLIKESAVPDKQIDLAIDRKKKFDLDSEQHTYKE